MSKDDVLVPLTTEKKGPKETTDPNRSFIVCEQILQDWSTQRPSLPPSVESLQKYSKA